MKNEKKTILFRVDSGHRIGSGHVMRCITIANELRRNFDVTPIFATVAHEGHVISKIEENGHNVHELHRSRSRIYGDHEKPPSHAPWLDSSWDYDAAQTRQLIRDLDPMKVVVDHYALDSEWERSAIQDIEKTFILDDLADRKHHTLELVDHTLRRKSLDYKDLVPKECKLHIGLNYAILRPEFLVARKSKIRGSIDQGVKKVLVSMGGVDTENHTQKVLSALIALPNFSTLEIDVVCGATAKNVEVLEREVCSLYSNVTLSVGVTDMSKRMLQADMAISSIGATTWELFCLGVPTVFLPIAENQVWHSKNISKSQLGKVIGVQDDLPHEIDQFMKNHKNRQRISKQTAELVDGNGASRIAGFLTHHT